MIKTVFIDLDDTLWATFENNKNSLSEIYTALNWGQYFFSFDDFFKRYLPHNDFLWSEYRQERITKAELTLERFRHPFRGIKELSDEEILGINRDFLARCSSKTQLCPGATEVMAYLKARYRIYILSNGFREVQQRKIDASGLASYVDGMVLSEDAGVNKPNPRIFAYAFEQAQATPETTVMIGDSWDADMVGAHRAHIPAIWYNPHHLPAGADEAKPTHTIDHLLELKKLL